VTEAAPLVLLCSPDLLLAVRVEASAVALGYRLRSAASPAEAVAVVAAETPAAAVVDLAAPGLQPSKMIAALRNRDTTLYVLGFFPHVRRELGAAARQAGCSLVVPRSRFMAELPTLLWQAVESGAVATAESGES